MEADSASTVTCISQERHCMHIACIHLLCLEPTIGFHQHYLLIRMTRAHARSSLDNPMSLPLDGKGAQGKSSWDVRQFN